MIAGRSAHAGLRLGPRRAAHPARGIPLGSQDHRRARSQLTDAEPLLRALGGPDAPEEWQGALAFKYHVGAGPATVRVKVDMDGATRPIWVVEGRIRGTEEPDKYVVLGNHRDAWVYGAVDPSSGTATQMELARVLGAMAREGKRPKRSIVLASWDAEEWHLTGSTEWGEHFAEDLQAQRHRLSQRGRLHERPELRRRRHRFIECAS